MHLILGLAYAQNKEQQKAAASYEKTIEANPENGLGYFYLGALYEQSGKRAQAYEALRKSVELDQENSDALNYLGYMYAVDGNNLEEAGELIKRALEIEPNNGAYADSLGWVYFKKGLIDEALVQIEKASEILEDVEVLEHLGDIYRVKGLKEKADQVYSRALELDPKSESVKKKIDNLKNEEVKNVTD